MDTSDQHEDEALVFTFQDEEIDMLGSYDSSIDDGDFDLQSGTCDNSEIVKLVFECTP